MPLVVDQVWTKRFRSYPWHYGMLKIASFNAASNSGYQAAASSYSWSHTCGGSNRFLAVDVSLLSAGQTVTSITYNGVALSLITSKSTVTSFGRVECWGLVNPPSGSNTIAVTLSGAIASVAGAVSYSNVNQTTPTEAANSAQATNVGAADATVTITPTTNSCLIHGVVATDDGSITAGQSSRNNVSGIGGSGANEDTDPRIVYPAAATAISYTNVAALATWAIAGYAIRPIGSPSTGYTLTGGTGSYTLTGIANSLKVTRYLSASASSYTLTGVAASLNIGKVVSASTASYTLTGVNATLRATRTLTGGTGSYSITGQAVTFKYTRVLIATTASYALTGQAAAPVEGHVIPSSTGTFTLTGKSAQLLYSKVPLSASPGSFVLTGKDASFSRAYILSASAGVFTLTGIGIAFVAPIPPEPEPENPGVSGGGEGGGGGSYRSASVFPWLLGKKRRPYQTTEEEEEQEKEEKVEDDEEEVLLFASLFD